MHKSSGWKGFWITCSATNTYLHLLFQHLKTEGGLQDPDQVASQARHSKVVSVLNTHQAWSFSKLAHSAGFNA